MSQHLRLTTPLPATVDGLTLLPGELFTRIVELGGLVTMGLYSLIAMHAESEFTRETLRALVPGLPTHTIDEGIRALLDAGIVAWVDEDEEGGEA